MNKLLPFIKYALLSVTLCLGFWLISRQLFSKNLSEKKADLQKELNEKKKEQEFLRSKGTKTKSDQVQYGKIYKEKLKELESLKASISEAQKPRINSRGVGGYHKVLGEIVKIAVEKGVETSVFETAYPDKKKDPGHLLEFQCTFPQFSSFVNSLKELDYRIIMRGLKINKLNKEGDLNISMEFSL